MITDGNGRPYAYRVEIAPVMLPPAPGPMPAAPPAPPRPLVYFCNVPDWRDGALVMTHAAPELGDPTEPAPWIVVPIAWPLAADITYIGPEED